MTAQNAMTLRLDDDLKAIARELSASLHLSQQDVLRKALRDLHAATRRRERVLSVMDTVAADYAEPLRRLGEGP